MAPNLLLFAGGITQAGGKQHPSIAFHDSLNYILTQHFHLYYPEQIPKNFRISQLPSKISSWVLTVLRIAASSLIGSNKSCDRT